jgi:flagellar biosynthesis protein FlhF
MIESTRHVTNGQNGAFGRSFVEVVAAPSAPGLSQRPTTRATRSPSRDAEAIASRPVVGGLGRARSNPATMERELVALRGLVDELSAGRVPRERARALLYSVGFEGELAKKLGTGATQAARGGREALRVWLRERVRERLLIEPNLIQRPYRQVISCVGPTGVGKTTTLAKLAARAKLDLQKSVSVISLDTFRVGAVEQWKRYAELIGVAFHIAEDATTFRRLVMAQSSDLILVDTAGKSTRNDNASLRLGQCFSELREIRTEVLLTLPAWIRPRDAERIVDSYQNPQLTGLIITKLDEAEQLGGSMHAALAGRLPITYLCDGARVPEDIHDAAEDAVLDAIFPEQV